MFPFITSIPGIVIEFPRAKMNKTPNVNKILVLKSLLEDLNICLKVANILNHLRSSTQLFYFSNSTISKSISFNS